jgi:hypothetical protein
MYSEDTALINRWKEARAYVSFLNNINTHFSAQLISWLTDCIGVIGILTGKAKS